MNIDQFAKKMNQRTIRFEKQSAETMKKLAIQAGQNVVLENPVLTGLSRSSWFTSIGSYSASKQGKEWDPKTLPLGVSTQLGIDNVRNGVKLYKNTDLDLFLVNNINYVPQLNERSGQKHDKGFIERSVKVAVKQILGNTNFFGDI